MLEPLLQPLAAVGLDVVGYADVASWDAHVGPARQSATLAPGARSILVIGNGGGTMWPHFVEDLRRDTRGLTQEANPLDAFVRRTILAADAALGATPRRWFFASADAELHLDFRLLAGLAGLGTQSRLGLLIHPRWGTWIGLRAACFLPFEAQKMPSVPDVCDGCAAPCVTACAGTAFPDGRWDVGRCATFHTESPVCERTCGSRLACPVGEENRYSPVQFAYHYHRESGRRALREVLGLPGGADPHEGAGPFWGTWKGRVDVAGKPG